MLNSCRKLNRHIPRHILVIYEFFKSSTRFRPSVFGFKLSAHFCIFVMNKSANCGVKHYRQIKAIYLALLMFPHVPLPLMTVNCKTWKHSSRGDGWRMASREWRVRLAYLFIFFFHFTWCGGIVVLTLCWQWNFRDNNSIIPSKEIRLNPLKQFQSFQFFFNKEYMGFGSYCSHYMPTFCESLHFCVVKFASCGFLEFKFAFLYK